MRNAQFFWHSHQGGGVFVAAGIWERVKVPADPPVHRPLRDPNKGGTCVHVAARQVLVRSPRQAELAVDLLKEALAAKPLLEVCQRLEKLLASAEDLASPPDVLRALRAVALLEQVQTPEARQELERLAKGAAGARLTKAAKASLERLGQRP